MSFMDWFLLIGCIVFFIWYIPFMYNNKDKTKQIKEDYIAKKSMPKVCDKCGSTDFTPVRRRWSAGTGLLTNKVDLICNKCGNRIK